ncbi:MAG TPA: GDP-mannose 4,6-dehydratase, partial [Terriglobales bacterium]|nr:GDP-mannose 4,6-dehydratase [Terriglobales bacterium]
MRQPIQDGMTQLDSPIILTGGAGFVGSHLAEALLLRGAKLTIIDNLDDFYNPIWKQANLQDIRRAGNCDFLQLDIRDFEKLQTALARIRPEVIIHLAARAGVRPSIE